MPRSAIDPDRLRLRRADPLDSHRVWEWNNATDVRAMSFSSEDIPWEHHQNWFAGRLADAGCILFIAEYEKVPIGHLRFQCDERSDVTISVTLDVEYRGRGLGSRIIRMGTAEYFRLTNAEVVHARIKPENGRSRQAFLSAGYTVTSEAAEIGHLNFRRGE